MNNNKLNMKNVISKTENAYQKPVCVSMNIFVEGLLCESSESEDYDRIGEYGDAGLDNKGWI